MMLRMWILKIFNPIYLFFPFDSEQNQIATKKRLYKYIYKYIKLYIKN